MDSGRDILKLHNGAVYKGVYKSKDDKMVTFHVDDMPKAQSLPLSMIQSVTLSDGYSIFESSSNEEFKKELENQTVRKTENSKIEKTKLTYVNTIDAEYIKNVKGGKQYDSYLAKNGALISIGDTLTIGLPATIDKQFGIGVTPKSVYSFILIGSLGFNAFVQVFSSQGETVNLSATSQGEGIIVEKIYVTNFKTNLNLQLPIIITGRNTMYKGLGKSRTITDIEKALSLGEIISGNAPMTRTEAVKKLKESKELLDLEIILQSEYDSIKKELTPIIRKKQ